jgi:hypothetical protein
VFNDIAIDLTQLTMFHRREAADLLHRGDNYYNGNYSEVIHTTPQACLSAVETLSPSTSFQHIRSVLAWLLVHVVRLLVDVVVFLGVVICESTTGEYIKYSASPNKRWNGGSGGII